MLQRCQKEELQRLIIDVIYEPRSLEIDIGFNFTLGSINAYDVLQQLSET